MKKNTVKVELTKYELNLIITDLEKQINNIEIRGSELPLATYETLTNALLRATIKQTERLKYFKKLYNKLNEVD